MTTQDEQIGVYGKLPAHGDFIRRNIASAFIDVWDHWLQNSLLCSQEQLKDQWLNNFMTSPMWRFALSQGCINNDNAWIGLLFPSVDNAGRYFPLSFIIPCHPDTQLISALTGHEEWFSNLERIAHATLEEKPKIDELMEVLQEITLPPLQQLPYKADLNREQICVTIHNKADINHKTTNDNNTNIHTGIEADSAYKTNQNLNNALCETVLQSQYPSYSAWLTQGSAQLDHSLMIKQGLPSYDGYSELLTGNWPKTSQIQL